MGDLSERIAALSPEKLALLERRLKRKGGQATETPIISSEERGEELSPSFAQERLWFLEQFQPGSAVYNIPGALRLPGAVNVGALEWAFNEIVRRHEILRTAFAERGGRPAQVVAPELRLTLPVDDLTGLSPHEREAETRRLAEREARAAFDLSRTPLLRVRLLRLGESEHLLLLTLHHIIADGWSLGILFRELSALYEAARQGRPSPLAPLPIQYADFARWQRRWLSGERLAAEVQYWRGRLAGAPEVLALPTDRPRPAVQSHVGAAHVFRCPREVAEGLARMAGDSGGTLFMVLLAAFKVLLYRYTGQSDLVVGTPIANRNRTELEELIGFFVNTLALRTDLSGNPTFEEVVRRVREVTLGAYEHQDVPFEKLVEELQPARSLGHAPLFQVLFALQNAPTLSLESFGLPATTPLRDPSEVGTGTSKFDLSIFFSETADGLAGGIEYNTDLFDQTTIERMSQHFESLLTEVAANPERRLSDFTLLTDSERRQLSQWNSTNVALPVAAGAQKLFEAQVERTPESVAAASEDASLTYRELNRRANQLAHFLRTRGVGPETCVGCCMESSTELLVSVLGILKAGGVYVPLDPSLPQRRLAFMVEDAGMPVVLTQKRFAASFPDSAAEVVSLDAEVEALGRQSEANPQGGVDPDHLAYVIYTSGSTGTPKGVAMPHRSLLNLINWQIQNPTFRRDARTLQFASPSFDVSIQEILATWCSGGSVLLTTEEVRRDQGALLEYLTDAAIDRLFMTPVALRHLAAAAVGSTKIPRLTQVIVAGEQLQITEPVANLFSRLGDCVLCNQYGPSESHVVSELILSGSPATRHWAPPIGRPIANTQLYVLDPATLNLLPVGVPGELCIGGVSLARGYFNRPGLTAEKFVPNQFSEEPGARLYRTGDLARYLPDGNIEFLGRIDQQVKIRGFRIEPGEVEAALGQHPSVKEAAVVDRADTSGERGLVAYVVPRAGEPPTVSDLHRFLLATLPRYMVPQTFVFLAALPLTVTGKVDRQALPAPERTRPELDAGFVAPRNPVEEKLAEIWADVLELERVGVHDSFFELGGHSLLATQVISRVRDAFQVEVPLKHFFEAPSVAEFAASMDESAAPSGQEVVSHRAIDSESDEQILAKLDDLTDEQIEILLARKLEQADGVAPVLDQMTPAPAAELRAASRRDSAELTLKGGNEAQILARLDDLSEQQVTSLLVELLAEQDMDGEPPPVRRAPPVIESREDSTGAHAGPVLSTRAEAAPTPDGRAGPLPPGAPERAWADFHRRSFEAHLHYWHEQHMIWLDAQRRLAEAHLHFLQSMQELGGALRPAISGESPLGAGQDRRAQPATDFPVTNNVNTEPQQAARIESRFSSDSFSQPAAAGPSEPPFVAGDPPTSKEEPPQEKRAALERPSGDETGKVKSAPLSFAQQRLWFLCQLQPDSSAYNVPSVLRLPGAVNVGALEWAFNEIVRRHEILRTAFAERGGHAAQVVAPELNIDLPVHDLTQLSPAEREEETYRLATAEAQSLFDLSRGPLIRIRLLRLGESEHLLLLTLHHIIADGWSLGILFRELSALYEAARQGRPSPLAPLPIQYADFARWQRRWLSGERLAAEVQYWRGRLAGAPESVALPTDRPRPLVQTYAGAAHVFRCPREVAEGLARMAGDSGGTLFMVLLAAFKVLLYRYTGQSDLVVGTPIANRNRTELEGLIGFFVNQLALRTDLSGDPTFAEVVGRVCEVTLGAYEHQDVPFEKLVEELQPARSLGHAPLFQIVFGLQNNPTLEQTPSAAETAQDAGPALPQVSSATAKMDMTWQLAQTPDGLIGAVEYATDLFDESTIVRMADRFQSLLEQIVDDPQKRLSDFRLLTESETGGRTLQDFPDLGMTQQDFENLLLEMREG